MKRHKIELFLKLIACYNDLNIMNKFTLSIAAFFICMLFPAPSFATTYDMGDTANWNIRFVGPANSTLGYAISVVIKDIDNNGSKDIIVGDYSADFNSRADSGSLYVIKHELFADLVGTGNSIDLSDPTNYSYRFDAAVAGDQLATTGVQVADINNNNIPDIIVGSSSSDYNSRSESGSVYIIYDSIYSASEEAGNIFDLANSSSYSIRIDGAAADDLLSLDSLTVKDINNDSKNDLLIGSFFADNNSRSKSGSIYALYNSLLMDYVGTGNTVDLSTPSNFNLRFDGAVANNLLGRGQHEVVDIDNDGFVDLTLGAGEADFNSKTNSGSVYIVQSSLFRSIAGTGNTIDMAESTNWTLRIDGATAGDQLGALGKSVTDINNNEYPDFLLGAFGADFNGRSGSGSLYAVYDDIISTYSGTGNTFQLSDTSKWNLRFDGPVIGDGFGSYTTLTGDLDNDGQRDIVAGTANGDVGSFTNAGSVFVIFNDLFNSLTGTGNTIDLLNSSNYSFRYDGQDSYHYLGLSTVIDDINLDGQLDLIMSQPMHTITIPSGTGYLHVIDYFPHVITHSETIGDIRKPFTFKGLVTAPNNPTSIARVQWGHQRSFGNLTATVSTDFENAWIDCNAVDGAFNSNTEEFTCSHSALDGRPHFTIPHDVFIRAQDTKGIWTPVANYFQHRFQLNDTSNGNNNASESRPHLVRNEAGIVKNSGGGSNIVSIIVSANTIPFDSFITVENEVKKSLIRIGAYWQISEVKKVWFHSFHNRATVAESLQMNPSVISMTYSNHDLAPPGVPGYFFPQHNLKLAYSSDGIKWKILQNSVVDTQNKTVASINKIGGYYMIVSTPYLKLNSTVRELFDIQHQQDFLESPVLKLKPVKKEAALTNKPIINNASFFQKILNYFKLF